MPESQPIKSEIAERMEHEMLSNRILFILHNCLPLLEHISKIRKMAEISNEEFYTNNDIFGDRADPVAGETPEVLKAILEGRKQQVEAVVNLLEVIYKTCTVDVLKNLK